MRSSPNVGRSWSWGGSPGGHGVARGVAAVPARFLRALLLLGAACAGPAFAQNGGPYAITSGVIAGGGATATTAGSDTLSGTIGQADAGHSAGGIFGVNGGFWKAPVATTTPALCVGDCNNDGMVTVDELLTAVNIALGVLPPNGCPALDTNQDGALTVDRLLVAVNNAITGCPSGIR